MPLAPVAKRGSAPPWWVWLIVGGVLLAGMLVVVSGVVVYLDQKKGASPDYVGAPVEASDASATTIVSDTATVAYAIESDWVDVADYVDIGQLTANLVAGTDLVGGHYTAEPGTTPLGTVLAFEATPEAHLGADLDGAIDGVFDGMTSTGIVIDGDPTSLPVTTTPGLEGRQAEFSGSTQGIEVQGRIVALGHGDRAVILQWISIGGPVDEAAFDALVNSIRIDA